MRILITGSTGLLGQALVRRLAASHEVAGVSRRVPQPRLVGAHLVCDLTDADAVARMVREVGPDAIVHAQAMSDVDRCELAPREAERQNITTLEHLCAALGQRAPLLVLISTDYVFDGRKAAPYDEEDEPRPLSVYGTTKLAAERVASRYPRAVVVRPSTIFGPGRANFCDQIVERARAGQTVEAFRDQTTSPTYTEDLAEGLEALIGALRGPRAGQLPKIVHLTNAGGCRRVEFAQRVLEWLGYPQTLLKPIAMDEQGRPAKRPAYSALTSRYLPAVIGRVLRPWDDALHAYLRHHHRSAFAREGRST